jgi:ribosomal protein S18 acetylase RimI-like enzyme
MINVIVALDKALYQGYTIQVNYETDAYYALVQTSGADGFAFSLVKHALPSAVEKSFTISLYPDYYPDAEAYGIFDAEKLIGLIEINHEKWNNRLRVTELWVEPDHRKHGIGKQLMDFALMKAKACKARAIILETELTNVKAITFYLEQGYEFFGIDLYCYSNLDVLTKEIRLDLGMLLNDD